MPVEEEQYSCSEMPCKAWSISDKKCYRCDKNCQQWGRLRTPSVRALLSQLSCDSDCSSLVVTSSGGAAVWQNKRTGLFTFVGEHNGRPLYQKNSTREYLYYVNGSEWLIGPDFKKAHGGPFIFYSRDLGKTVLQTENLNRSGRKGENADIYHFVFEGIQIFNNDDSQCPERHGGTNNTKVYIDSSQPLLGNSNIWREDDTLKVECFDQMFTKVAKGRFHLILLNNLMD